MIPYLYQEFGIITLRVQSTHIWSIYGFFISNLNHGVGYMLHVWVLGACNMCGYQNCGPLLPICT